MSGESKTGKTSDQEKLAGALGTIIEVMVGRELAAMKASVTDLDSTLTKQIGAMKKDTKEVIDGLMKDLSSRIDDLLEKLSGAEDRQKKAMSEIEDRNRKANEELQQRLTEAQSKTGERMQKMQTQLEQELANKEEALMHELGNLAQGLSTVQLDLQEQIQASARTSNLLNNMASVLTGGQQIARAQAGPPAPTAQTAPPAQAPASAESGNGNDDGLDSALDRVFSGGNN